MKKGFTISLVTLLLGWFIFMFLCVWGSNHSPEIRIAIMFIGLIICVVSTVIVLSHTNSKTFWDNIETYNKKMEELQEIQRKYEVAEKALVNKLLEGSGVSKN